MCVGMCLCVCVAAYMCVYVCECVSVHAHALWGGQSCRRVRIGTGVEAGSCLSIGSR